MRLETRFFVVERMGHSLAKRIPRQEPVGKVLSVQVPSANEVL